MSNKSELRQVLLQTRLALSADEVVHKSAFIVRELKQIIKQTELTAVHYYEPILSLNEVDIRPLIQFISTRYPQVMLHTSRKIDSAWQTVAVRGESPSQAIQYDLVLVPMLGFDNALYRLGYGGAYYDQMLLRQLTAQKIGVCFELGHQASIPHDVHDVPMDSIVSEEGVYRQQTSS